MSVLRPDPIDRVLTQALRSANESARADCPPAGELASWCERSLNAVEAARIETHISDCPRCQTIVASIARAEESAAPAQVARGWRWLLEVRLMAPALAGIIAIVVLARAFRNSATHTEAHQQIALNASNQLNPPPQSQMQPSVPLQPSAPLQPTAPRRHAAVPPAEVLRQQELARHAAPRHSAAATEAPEQLTSSPSAGEEQPGQAEAYARLSQAQPSTPAAAAKGASEPGAPPTSARGEWPVLGSASLSPVQTSGPAGGGVGAAITGSNLPNRGTIAMRVQQEYGNRLIQAPDHSVSWIVGSGGSIARNDPALGTRSESSGVSADLTTGSAVSSQICWVVGRSGTVLRTIDGEHWQVLPTPISEDLVAVNAQSADFAEVTAQSGARFTTADGGKTWQRQ